MIDRIHIVLDETDSRECAAQIGALHDIDAGRIVVRPTGPVTSRSLGRDMLRALGKRLELPESPPQRNTFDAVSLWLAAEQVRHLYVLRAHLLDSEAVRLIVSVLDSTTDVWFVTATRRVPAAISTVVAEFAGDAKRGDPGSAREPPTDHDRGVAPLPDVRPFREVVDKRDPRSSTATVLNRPWPPVPEHDEFWTFRASARALLEDADFARIDHEMHVGRIAARGWIADRVGLVLARFRRDDIEAFLTGLLSSATAREQALARVRGAQCAFFLGGTLVELPATGLAVSRANGPAPLDGAAVGILRGFAAPRLAAAGALALACQLPPSVLCKVTVGCVGPDGSHLSVGRARFSIPEPARGLVRAQVLASDDGYWGDPLFEAPEAPLSPTSPAQMFGMLKRISRCTGLGILPDFSADAERRASPAWLRADALKVTSLESLGLRERDA